MSFSLHQLTVAELQTLAADRVPADFEGRFDCGALPPAFVAARSLRLMSEGHGLPWATSYLIVRDADQRFIGGCGFKSVPADGRVDLGYAVAPGCQRQGAASAALKLLASTAFAAGATEVLAEILPGNDASTRVVQKCGFVRMGEHIDSEGDLVTQWVTSNVN